MSPVETETERENPFQAGIVMATHAKLFHRPAGAGRTFWGPGDLYTFVVTGAESRGSYFAMEALVPPGGGPPPHIHRNEDETFYLIEGQCTIRLGDDMITASAGDFVNIPRGTVHCFRNEDTRLAGDRGRVGHENCARMSRAPHAGARRSAAARTAARLPQS